MAAITREAILRGIPATETEETAVEDLFEGIVRDEYARIRGLAWNFGVPESELDDATQEIFARAWGGLRRFRGDSQPATWLTRIAVNYLTSWRRTMTRRLRVMVRSDKALQNAVAKPGLAHEAAEAHERAMACICTLPAKLRAAFVLRYIEGMRCAQIADHLGIPEATVRSRTYHARKRLRKMMRGYKP